MKKKVLTILLTALMFLSAVALGTSTVFRVEEVSVQASVISESGKSQVRALREKCTTLYQKQSTFSADASAAQELLSEYPYLRITDFKKSYPDRVIITVVEDGETYAVKTQVGYYIVSDEGVVVALRENPSNRLDSADNVLILGLQVSGKRGEGLKGDDCWTSVLDLCQGMENALGGIRKNMLSVEVLTRSPETFYRVSMREGVKVYIDNPFEKVAEKAKVAVDKYLSLADDERMTGCITLHEVEGNVVANYSLKDEFEF